MLGHQAIHLVLKKITKAGMRRGHANGLANSQVHFLTVAYMQCSFPEQFGQSCGLPLRLHRQSINNTCVHNLYHEPRCEMCLSRGLSWFVQPYFQIHVCHGVNLNNTHGSMRNGSIGPIGRRRKV